MNDKKLIINEVKNSGLILEPPRDKDHIGGVQKEDKILYGVVSPQTEPPIIFPDNPDWNAVCEDTELQFNRIFDGFDCVLFGIAKATRWYLKKVYNIETTIAEMYNAFFANVKQGYGTTIHDGMESFRLWGWVEDKDYPFTESTTLKQFQTRPPQSIILKAKGQLEVWDFHWEALVNDNARIGDYYKRTPVVFTGFAWASYYGEGVYYDYNNPANHAFAGGKIKENGNNLISDNYPKDFEYKQNVTDDELIKELDKDFHYGSMHRCWLTPNYEKTTLINKLKNMFKKISRDIHGGFWFLKTVNGVVMKQKIEDLTGFMGAIIDEIGVANNNLTDEFLAKTPDFNFFGK